MHTAPNFFSPFIWWMFVRPMNPSSASIRIPCRRRRTSVDRHHELRGGQTPEVEVLEAPLAALGAPSLPPAAERLLDDEQRGRAEDEPGHERAEQSVSRDDHQPRPEQPSGEAGREQEHKHPSAVASSSPGSPIRALSEPGTSATALVALAATGETPAARSAGKVITVRRRERVHRARDDRGHQQKRVAGVGRHAWKPWLRAGCAGPWRRRSRTCTARTASGSCSRSG